MKIGDFETKSNIFLAPMAGYSDVAFREQCKFFGAGLTTTEMVSAKGLIYDSEKTKELLYTSKLEDIKVVQLFGHEPDVMYRAIQHPVLEEFDVVDINMGCPAPKIVKNGEGSFLMTNIDLASEIVGACVRASKRPVTVKMRLGYEENNAVQFAKAIEKAGASMITVHGRLKSQGYSGFADYEEIAKVKKAINIPVVANGDVVDRESYQKILKVTGCDAVAIGRGAVGNPHIFAELTNSDIPFNKYDCIKNQFELLMKYYDERFVVLNMRKQLLQYFKGIAIPNDVKLQLLQKTNVEAVLNFLQDTIRTYDCK